MDKSIFSELLALGFYPLPLIWDENARQALHHPEHAKSDVNINQQYINELLSNGYSNTNGVALKVFPPLGFFDFDTKNAKNKGVYDEWFKIISSTNPDVLRKCCIEKTRSGGHHVYIKYANASEKIAIARNDGAEVISFYTGGLLAYCAPTPGYELVHNDFNDVDFVTQDEFDFLYSTAALFNEDKDFKPGEKTVALQSYPIEYESTCIQFDTKITDHAYEALLNSLTLFPVKEPENKYKKPKLYLRYLRKGSNAAYSAKVYWQQRRLLLFTASLKGFPCYHDQMKEGDSTWSLSPSKIIYYKNNRSWVDTMAEIEMICDSAGIDIVKPAPITQQPLITQSKLKFPLDIFPDFIHEFMAAQPIQYEYLATTLMVALSTAIGNSVFLEAKEGYLVKPVMYMAIVAPAGIGKTPAMKKIFSPVERYDKRHFAEYAMRRAKYDEDFALWQKDKKNNEAPVEPQLHQTLIKDSTIEMVAKIMSTNTLGCTVYADELTGFLNRMNRYTDGDEVQKWLEFWSSSSVLIQRVTKEPVRIEDPYCNIIGGIQPGVLNELSKGDKESNGFYHRFLFVYPDAEPKPNWRTPAVPQRLTHIFTEMFNILLRLRESEKVQYFLSPEADDLYNDWYDYKNTKYNRAQDDNVRGIIAKYQDYCLRFSILLQAMYDGEDRRGVIEVQNVERAIRLTDYFLANMHKSLKLLAPETPVDRLKSPYDVLYKALPESFTQKTAIEIAKGMNIKEGTVKSFLVRGGKDVFEQPERGKYLKLY